MEEKASVGYYLGMPSLPQRPPLKRGKLREAVDKQLDAGDYVFRGFCFPDDFVVFEKQEHKDAFSDCIEEQLARHIKWSEENPEKKLPHMYNFSDYIEAHLARHIKWSEENPEKKLAGVYNFSDYVFPASFEFKRRHIPGDLILSRCRFEGNAGLTNMKIDGELRLSHSRVLGILNLQWSSMGKRTDLTNTVICGGAEMWGTSFGREAVFCATRFQSYVLISGAELPPTGAFEGMKVQPGQGEPACRFAKQVCQNMGDYEEAGKWHIEERRHRRVSARRRRAKWEGWAAGSSCKGKPPVICPCAAAAWMWAAFVAGVEWLGLDVVSRYCERPLRVAVAGGVLVFIFAVFYCLPCCEFREAMAWYETPYFSTVTATTLGFGDFAPVSLAARSASMIEAVLGAWLMALFVVCLARRHGRG